MSPHKLAHLENDDMLSNVKDISEEEKLNILFFLKEVQFTSFSLRAKNHFKLNNIIHVYEVTQMSKEALLKEPNLGAVTLNEIENELFSNGLRFGMTLKPSTDEFRLLLKSRNLQPPPAILISRNIDSFLEFSKILNLLGTSGHFSVSDLDTYYSINNFDSVLAEMINKCFESFEEREQLIARSRVFTVGERCSLEALGDLMGVTRERVRQIEAKLRRKIKNKFSSSLHFLDSALARLCAKNIDPFIQVSESKPFFLDRETFTKFLSLIGVSVDVLSYLRVPEDVPDATEICDNILLNYAMPLSKIELEGILTNDYSLSQVQMHALIQEQIKSLIHIVDDQVFIEPPTKVLAIANIALAFPNGAPWLDLARIAKSNYEKCKNIRVSPCADQSISSNPYLYLCDRGTYRHIKYYDISPREESLIEGMVYEYIQSMDQERKPLNLIKQDLELNINLYDLLYLLKERSSRFNILSKSGRMLILKNSEDKGAGYSVNNVVVDFLKKKKMPLTTFQIKDCLISSSEGHASFILSQLIGDGVVIKFDGARYALLSMIEESQISIIKEEIKTILLNSHKVVVGSYLKDYIESRHNFHYSRFLYSSIAQIVCKENSFYWVRHACSRQQMAPDFSLTKYLDGILLADEFETYESFLIKARLVLDIDEHNLKIQFSRLKSKATKRSKIA